MNSTKYLFLAIMVLLTISLVGCGSFQIPRPVETHTQTVELAAGGQLTIIESAGLTLADLSLSVDIPNNAIEGDVLMTIAGEAGNVIAQYIESFGWDEASDTSIPSSATISVSVDLELTLSGSEFEIDFDPNFVFATLPPALTFEPSPTTTEPPMCFCEFLNVMDGFTVGDLPGSAESLGLTGADATNLNSLYTILDDNYGSTIDLSAALTNLQTNPPTIEISPILLTLAGKLGEIVKNADVITCSEGDGFLGRENVLSRVIDPPQLLIDLSNTLLDRDVFSLPGLTIEKEIYCLEDGTLEGGFVLKWTRTF